MADLSPSQTVGPFFHHALMRTPWRSDLVAPSDENQISVRGRVLREGGRPVDDAMIEMWQAGPNGGYRSEPSDAAKLIDELDFAGFGRAATNPDGYFEFRTLRPGNVPDVNGRTQAAHLNLHIFARGLTDRLATRVYLPEGLDPNEDPVLSTVEEQRQKTLIAQRMDARPFPMYTIEIILRGPEETVFFAV